ncbi:phytoene/squalene synthase family protein [Rubritalea tangerina]|uniref:Phytoene/squalene synthase family protein n=1 Tax=Rubritalea tangerina TaxID=430798 RepID=A0ABW4ZAX5_9BACT
MSEAATITQQAKSNLAFAFLCLPKDRRDDMVTFYAFCRVIDDLADEPDIPMEEKRAGLDSWIQCFSPNGKPETPLQKETLQLRDRYGISNQLFLDLIEGCESDLNPHRRFANWDELKEYTYRVASIVGLISIEIFGCTSEQSKKYAVALGHALQLTNILRDVGEDLADRVRIYIPLNDMDRFQYTERDLIGKVYDGRFINMMHYIAERAEAYYQEAIENLPECDKRALRAAEGMRRIYHGILKKMRDDNFQVFDQRYSLPKWKKLVYLFGTQLGF